MTNKLSAVIVVAVLIMGSLAAFTAVYTAGADVTDQYVINLNSVGTNCTVLTNSTQDTYNYGDIVQLTPVAAPGYTFDSWSGDLIGIDNPATIAITANLTITATFTQDNYTLTINTVGQGNVVPGNQTYFSGTSVDLQATPTDGWNFTGWSGDLNDAATNSTVIMDTNKTLTATFTQITNDATQNTTPTATPTPTITTTPSPTTNPTSTPHTTADPTTTPPPTRSPTSTVTNMPQPTVAQSSINGIAAVIAAAIFLVIAAAVCIAKRKK